MEMDPGFHWNTPYSAPDHNSSQKYLENFDETHRVDVAHEKRGILKN